MNIKFQIYFRSKEQFSISTSNSLKKIQMDFILLLLILNILLAFNANHYACDALKLNNNQRNRRSHHSLIRPSDYYKINQYPYPSAYSSSLLNDEIPSSFLFNKKSLLGELKRDYSNEILTNEILATREKAAKTIDFDTILSQKEKELIHDAIQKRLIDRLKSIYLVKTRTR